MKVISAYTKGWRTLFSHKKMWLMVYIFNVMFAVIILLPANNFLSNTIGNSLASDKILKKFDYPYISDIIDHHTFTMSMIKDQSIVLIILFLLFSIFLMGGIIGTIRSGEFSFRLFWSDCGYYFWRLFRLTLFFFIIHGILLWLATQTFSSIGLNPFEMESDIAFVRQFKLVGAIYLIFAVFIFMIQDYSKLQIVKMDRRLITQPILNSIKLILKNFFPCLLLYFFNICFFFLVIGIYYFINISFEMTSDGTIFLAFIMGQLLLILRVGLKFLNLMSANYLMENIEGESPDSSESSTSEIVMID